MNGYWEPGIEYTLTVDPDIRDIYGRSLRDGDPKYLASGEVKIEAGPGGRRSCTFSVVFPDRISSVFFPNDVRTFQRGTDPVFSVAASGKLTGATLQLKRYLPDNQVYHCLLYTSPSPRDH